MSRSLEDVLGVVAASLLQGDGVRLVAVLVVHAPDRLAGDASIATAISALSPELGASVVDVLREAADKIEARGLGHGIDLGPARQH